MLVLHQRLCPRRKEIATKLIDDKAIIINLATGTSYTTQNVGKQIWETIQGKHSLEETVSVMINLYEVSAERAYQDVLHFAAELFRHGLIRTLENGEPTIRCRETTQNRKLTYQTPILTIGSDIEDLLVLHSSIAVRK